MELEERETETSWQLMDNFLGTQHSIFTYFGKKKILMGYSETFMLIGSWSHSLFALGPEPFYLKVTSTLLFDIKYRLKEFAALKIRKLMILCLPAA